MKIYLFEILLSSLSFHFVYSMRPMMFGMAVLRLLVLVEAEA